MNKQEAIRELMSKSREIIFGDDENMYLSRKRTIELVSQIDEPQKVVVPKFVAEWIVEAEKIHNNLSWVWFSNPVSDELNAWLKNHTETFMRAWLDGYTVEKEKLYTVEIPNPNRTTEPIIYLLRDERGNIFLNSWLLFASQSWKNHPHAHLTESEIKQDFEWAWDAGFAKEVE